MADENPTPVAPETTPATEANQEIPGTPPVTEPQEGVPAEPAESAENGPISAEEATRIRTALAKANKEAQALRLEKKQRDDAQLSELDKARRDAEEASKQLATLERDNLRKTVALDTGLPAKWAARLSGETEEELLADAKAILADLNRPRTPAPDPSQGPRTSAKSEDDQLYESIYGARKA